jgi:hypothetical protein
MPKVPLEGLFTIHDEDKFRQLEFSNFLPAQEHLRTFILVDLSGKS